MDFLAFLDFNSVNSWLEAGGYLFLFLILFSMGLGLPLPEDIPLVASGVLIANGKFHLVPAAIAAWCGIIAGDIVLYHLGKKFGLEITRLPLIGKHVTKERIERVEQMFVRYGVWVVAVGRLFAGVRGAMVIAAGATRFNLVKFIIADGLAALVSGGLFVGAGYWLGQKAMQDVEEFKHILTYIVIGLVVLGSGYWLWRRKKHKSLAEVALAKAEKVAERSKETAAVEK